MIKETLKSEAHSFQTLRFLGSHKILRLAACPVRGRNSDIHGKRKSSRTVLKLEVLSKLTITLG